MRKGGNDLWFRAGWQGLNAFKVAAVAEDKKIAVGGRPLDVVARLEGIVGLISYITQQQFLGKLNLLRRAVLLLSFLSFSARKFVSSACLRKALGPVMVKQSPWTTEAW